MEKRERRLFKPMEQGQSRKSNFLNVEGGEEVDVLIGETLRRAREQLGYDLQQVSDALRIRRAHLEALEEGRYRDLPGATYAIGFFRSYARFLGLDADEIVERFKSQSQDLVKEQKLDFPLPSSEGRMPRVWLVVVAIVLAVLAYAGWQYFSREGEMTADLGSAVPDKLESMATETLDATEPETALPAAETGEAGLAAPVAPAGEVAVGGTAPEATAGAEEAEATEEAPAAGEAVPAETAAVTPPEATLLPEEEAPAEAAPAAAPPAEVAEVPAAPETGLAETTVAPPSEPTTAAPGATPSEEAASPVPEEEEEFAPPPPSAAETETVSEGPIQVSELPPPQEALAGEAQLPMGPRVYGEPGGRVTITATADSWVQIVAPGGEILLTRILHGGDMFYVPDQPGLTLTTGNAGALEIRVDGKPTPAIGGPGIVRHDVRLDPEVLLSQTPLPE